MGRICDSESVVETDKGSLEPSPSPAVFLHEPQEESGGQASPGTCSSETVMDLKECSQASRGQEVMDRDATWKGTFEPSLLIKYQIVNIDMIKIIIYLAITIYTITLIIGYIINLKLFKKGVNVE